MTMVLLHGLLKYYTRLYRVRLLLKREKNLKIASFVKEKISIATYICWIYIFLGGNYQ